MRYSLLFVLLFGGTLLTGQVRIGLSAGGGLSSRAGLRLALPVEWTISSNFHTQLEMVFLQRSQPEIIRNLPGDRDYRQVDVHYFTWPLLAKGRLNFGALTLYGLAGPQVGYGVHLAANYLDDRGRLYRQELSFSEGMISRFDLGVTLGFGIEKEISKRRKIFFDLRHYIGLFDLDADPDREIYHDGQLFSLGILFPVGGGE